MPADPGAAQWDFPDPRGAADDLVALGGDWEPATLLGAYRNGLFPMPLAELPDNPIGWFSPEPRAVLPLDGLRVSRSLRASCRSFEVRVDTAFDEVVTRCARTTRQHGWITDEVREAYGRLHRLGWAHSVESWTFDDKLAGGLYGVSIGGLFAGESMWHEPARYGRDASKVALVDLVARLQRAPDAQRRVLDVQWLTPHLASLGAVGISRADYLDRLQVALRVEPLDLAGRS